MKIRELARLVAHYEKGKQEVSIAQIAEILKVIADMGPEANECLWVYSKYRARKRKVKKSRRIKRPCFS